MSLPSVLRSSVVVSTLIVPMAVNGHELQSQGGGGQCVTETLIYNFTGSNGDGDGPTGPLVAETAGLNRRVDALYGVTIGGGSSVGGCALDGCGTAYKLSRPAPGETAWTETLPFAEFQGSNGAVPAGGLLLRRSAGFTGPEFFGTTLYGGSTATGAANSGYGTVFSLVNGALTTLWNFSAGDDGRSPSGALITDDAAGSPGALYGTTRGFHAPSYGTVFTIDPRTGSLSTIWSFSGSDGWRPLGALLADKSGALYGMTFKDGPNGFGTVFKLTPPGNGQSSWSEQILWAFTGASDGGNPEQPDALVMDDSGALYGTAFTGGSNNTFCGTDGCGVVFKLIPPAGGQTAWTEQTLWAFSGGNDGAYPISGVILDRAGAVYGMTNGGGNPGCIPYQAFESGCGVVFKLTPPRRGQTAWNLTTLWSFSGPPSDGANPLGGLIADETGALYGVTASGGSSLCVQGGCGTVFQLT